MDLFSFQKKEQKKKNEGNCKIKNGEDQIEEDGLQSMKIKKKEDEEDEEMPSPEEIADE